jgi:hypothetical protein
MGDKAYRREQPLSLISPTSGKRPVMKNAIVIVRFTILCGITSTKCVLKELVAHPVDYIKDSLVYQARLGVKQAEAFIDMAKGDDSTFEDLVKQLTREDGPEFITPSIQRVIKNYYAEMKPAIESLAAM